MSDTAIEALRYSEFPNSSDCISRQAAIRWVKTECNPYGKPTLDFESGKKVIEHLKQMPSAQPEPCDDAVSRDSVSKWLDRWEGYIDKDMINRMQYKVCDIPSVKPDIPTVDTPTVVPTCEDTISRQDAIRVASGYCHPANIAKELAKLPSAQPERQKGEWIDYTEDGYVECPFCHSATNCDGNKDELHFCFSCGADMRKPEDIPMEYFESGGR